MLDICVCGVCDGEHILILIDEGVVTEQIITEAAEIFVPFSLSCVVKFALILSQIPGQLLHENEIHNDIIIL